MFTQLLIIGCLLFSNIIDSGEINNYEISVIKGLPNSIKPLYSNTFHHKNLMIKIEIGVCKECGRALEKYLIKIHGLESVELNRKSKTLKIVYDPAYLTELDIHKKIAGQGYDTEVLKSDDDAYNSLAECCRYRETK